MKKKTTILSLTALFMMFALSNATFAKSNYNYNTQNNIQTSSDLRGYASFVPAGINCDAVLSNEINSQNAIVGQTINAILTDNLTYNGKTIAPKGSTVNGSVISNKKAGFGNRNGQTQVRFTNIRTPYNNIIPISAVVMTNDSTGVLKGGTAKDSFKEYAKNTAIGAGSGAALGTAMGALSSGSVGKGAIYGTALGAGLGVAKGIASKGDNVLIPANSQIRIFFDQPITLTAQ